MLTLKGEPGRGYIIIGILDRLTGPTDAFARSLMKLVDVETYAEELLFR